MTLEDKVNDILSAYYRMNASSLVGQSSFFIFHLQKERFFLSQQAYNSSIFYKFVAD